MDHTVRGRFARIREAATQVEEDAGYGRWDSALAGAVTLNRDVAFIMGWLRSQADHRVAGGAAASMAVHMTAGVDTWEPPAEPPLENVTEPLSGTLDADLPGARD